MRLALDGRAFIGGHPDCNQGATLLVERRRGRYLPLVPKDEKMKRLFADILTAMGAISTLTTKARAGSSIVPYRVAGASRAIRFSPYATSAGRGALQGRSQESSDRRMGSGSEVRHEPIASERALRGPPADSWTI